MRDVITALFVVLAPPAQYDHPYQGALTVHHASVREIMYDRCYVRGRGIGYACSYLEHLKDGRCEIWLPRVGDTVRLGRHQVTIGYLLYAAMLAHETAHCNGWRSDHHE